MKKIIIAVAVIGLVGLSFYGGMVYKKRPESAQVKINKVYSLVKPSMQAKVKGLKADVPIQTNYVFYNTNGRIQKVSSLMTYNEAKDTLQMDDVTMGGIDWTVMALGSFTGAIPEGLVNTNQIIITKIRPLSEQEYQDAKSPSLKMLENIYIDFLANMWTPMLRTNNIIAQDATVTVENTDESGNMLYLMMLRQKDYANYDLMANEFLRLKTAINGQGGIMSKVKFHAQ